MSKFFLYILRKEKSTDEFLLLILKLPKDDKRVETEQGDIEILKKESNW